MLATASTTGENLRTADRVRSTPNGTARRTTIRVETKVSSTCSISFSRIVSALRLAWEILSSSWFCT
jgi:hypothetical protein